MLTACCTASLIFALIKAYITSTDLDAIEVVVVVVDRRGGRRGGRRVVVVVVVVVVVDVRLDRPSASGEGAPTEGIVLIEAAWGHR